MFRRPKAARPGIPALILLLSLSGTATAQPDPEPGAKVPVEDLAPAAADSSFFPGAAVDSSLATAKIDSVAGSVSLLPEPEPLNLWSTGASPAGAVLMSPLFPGWGQLYTEGGWRSALAFGSQMWFWSRMVTRDRRAVRARHFATRFETDSAQYTGYNLIAEEDWEQMRDFAWWSGGAMFIIALDAYVGAHLFHFDEDPVPVPNRWDDIFDRPGGDMPGSTAAPPVVVMQWNYRF